MAEVCYRHPDRETAVSCSSCGRPICTDCMIPSPVGMRCPECGGERQRVVRPSQGSWASGTMPATYAFMAISVAVFVADAVLGSSLIDEGALCGPAIADGGRCGSAIAPGGGELYRLVTSGFLHGGTFHLLVNMFALYILGSLLEPTVGTARMAGIYAVSLLAGSFGALLLDPGVRTVGASGAIYGIFGATFLIMRERGVEQIASQIGLWLVLNLVITFSIPQISIGGHLGGLAGGGLVALAILAAKRELRGRARVAAEAAALLAIGVISVVGALIAAGQSGSGFV